jgi:hypothetical protein
LENNFSKGGIMSEQNEIKIKPTNIRIIWYNSKLFLLVLIIFAYCEFIFGILTDIDRFIFERIILFVILVSFFSIRDIYKRENKIITVSSLGLSKISGYKVDNKVFIAFTDIDIQKTMKHNILQNIFGTRSIYSITKTFIEYTPQYYSRKDQIYLQKLINNNHE